MIAVDTSVLIHAERNRADLAALLPETEEGPFYIPAHAAAEFLIGTHLPVREDLRRRALDLYNQQFRDLVDTFGEDEAARLAQLIALLRKSGATMKFFDAAIAATALARGHKVWCLDSDFDRVPNLEVIGITAQ